MPSALQEIPGPEQTVCVKIRHGKASMQRLRLGRNRPNFQIQDSIVVSIEQPRCQNHQNQSHDRNCNRPSDQSSHTGYCPLSFFNYQVKAV